eukprot:3916044-Amphidinium_carterae.1
MRRAGSNEEGVIHIDVESHNCRVEETLCRPTAKGGHPTPKGRSRSASKDEDVEHIVLVSHPHHLILCLALVYRDHVECVPH